MAGRVDRDGEKSQLLVWDSTNLWERSSEKITFRNKLWWGQTSSKNSFNSWLWVSIEPSWVDCQICMGFTPSVTGRRLTLPQRTTESLLTPTTATSISRLTHFLKASSFKQWYTPLLSWRTVPTKPNRSRRTSGPNCQTTTKWCWRTLLS